MSSHLDKQYAGYVVFWGEDARGLARLCEFLREEFILFGYRQTSATLSKEANTVHLFEEDSFYLQDRKLFQLPYRLILEEFPNVRIKVVYRPDSNNSWQTEYFGPKANDGTEIWEIEKNLADKVGYNPGQEPDPKPKPKPSLPPPRITIHPASQSVVAGSNLTLSVNATGSGPLTYQWQKNGVLMPGATHASYTIKSKQTGLWNILHCGQD